MTLIMKEAHTYSRFLWNREWTNGNNHTGTQYMNNVDSMSY